MSNQTASSVVRICSEDLSNRRIGPEPGIKLSNYKGFTLLTSLRLWREGRKRIRAALLVSR